MTMLPLRPIKIFADAHIFDQAPQGSRTCMKQIYKRLAQKPGFQLLLAARDIENLKAEFGMATSISYLSYSSDSRWKRLLVDIPGMIKKYQPDLSHFQYIPPLFNKVPVLVTLHDILYEEYPEQFSAGYRLSKKILFGHGARKADQLITVSKHSAEAIVKKWPATRNKLHVIPNGVDDRFFESYEKEKEKEKLKARTGLHDFILFVSRWEKRKGHIDLLNAWLELEAWKNGLSLVFVGNKGAGLPEFEKRLTALDESKRNLVHILEQVTEDELLSLYRSALVFVYPSYAEGFGLPPLEAGAAGTAVICSNSSAMSEFDLFGKGCFDPGKSGALTKTLHQSLNEPLGEKEKDQIKETIRQRYSWEKAADQHAELMIKMAGPKK